MIAEYIWNGFDANATKVDLSFQYNDLQNLSLSSITDNGCGISKETLLSKFTPVFDSNKSNSRQVDPRNSSLTHGKNGVGRFTFFTFAEQAVWTTVYANEDRHYKYSIEIHRDSLDKYYDSDVAETDDPVGTTVAFSNFFNAGFDFSELSKYLSLEFAWYLELNKEREFCIAINNQLLDYSTLLAHSETKQYVYKKTGTVFDVTFCRWNSKLQGEYSKYYYIKSKGVEVYKENTTLNNKGDKFYHSVFIRSTIFDDFMYEADEDEIVLYAYTKSSLEFSILRNKLTSTFAICGIRT